MKNQGIKINSINSINLIKHLWQICNFDLWSSQPTQLLMWFYGRLIGQYLERLFAHYRVNTYI